MTGAKVTHTPGPWYFTGEDFYRVRELASDAVVATVEDGEHISGDPIFGDDVVHANARLISAAPEMLDVLTHIVKDLEILGMDSEAGWDCWTLMAKAAIAKAEGET